MKDIINSLHSKSNRLLKFQELDNFNNFRYFIKFRILPPQIRYFRDSFLNNYFKL